MAFYYVCESSSKSDTFDEMTLDVGDEITQEELDRLNHAFSLTGVFCSITFIKDIVIENGIEFKKWMNPIHLQSCFDSGMPSQRLVMMANKYVLNYASSIKTFIDMALRLLKKKHPSKTKDFENLTHQFYDNKITYRFWVNFRNYIVHCAFPYTTFHHEIDKACEVICKRNHLLEFDNWKHSRNDIEKLPEDVDLTGMVDEMSSLVISLYLQFLYYFATQAFEGYEYYKSFLLRHKVNRPVILTVDQRVTKEEGFINPAMQPLPVEMMIKMFKVMQNHPSININFVEIKDDKG